MKTLILNPIAIAGLFVGIGLSVHGYLTQTQRYQLCRINDSHSIVIDTKTGIVYTHWNGKFSKVDYLNSTIYESDAVVKSAKGFRVD